MASSGLCKICLSYLAGLFDKTSYLGRVEGWNRLVAKREDFMPIDLWMSSSTTCSLCRAILVAFKKKYFSYIGHLNDRELLQFFNQNFHQGPLKIEAFGQEGKNLSQFDSNASILSILEELGLEIYCIVLSTPLHMEHFPPGMNGFNIGFDLWVDDEHPSLSVKDIARKKHLLDTGTEQSFHHIRRWLQECLVSHADCSQMISGNLVDNSKDPPLPSRIIELNGAHRLRLIESSGRTGQYAALSHCWGPPDKKPLSTLTANLKSHLHQIPFEEMPKSFQDAIITTRELGLGYLWIDSLCIIQDSISDWIREARLMGSVYQNAQVTIAAADAIDSSKGCFIKDWDDKTSSVELPYYQSTGITTNSSFHIAPGVSSPHGHTHTMMPLRTRAWCVQERVLSRRMITFGNGDVFWNCKNYGIETLDRRGCTFLSGPDGDSWLAILQTYCSCNLTNYGDMLIALDGIAIELQKTKPSAQYRFGMWMDEMPGLLLWAGKTTLRPNDRVANVPSWSWASMIGPRFIWYYPENKHPYEEYKYLTSEVRIEDTTNLRVRAPLIKGFSGKTKCPRPVTREWYDITDLTRSCGLNLHHLQSAAGDCGRRSCGFCVFDTIRVEEFYCLFVAKVDMRRGTASAYAVILLQLVDLASLVFRRIGIGEVTDMSWIKGADTTDIVLK